MNQRAPRNRTLNLTAEERAKFAAELSSPAAPLTAVECSDKLFHGDLFECLDFFPDAFADLLFLDPPYNLAKNYHGFRFSRSGDSDYEAYLESWFPRLLPMLKPTASVYLCCDWQSSAACYRVMAKYLKVRNRITWQREKGRGAKSNWKNGLEDIWFATVSNRYTFNVDAVKIKRKVVAPYRENGLPKDWQESADGKFRLTCPSNFWDDLTVPYWSMPENTDHPTQKPEKLLAKLILASSNPGDLMFDPFAGSGTSAVTAQKLGRRYCALELNREYCLWGLARLERAAADPRIQGYDGNVFYERNSAPGK